MKEESKNRSVLGFSSWNVEPKKQKGRRGEKREKKRGTVSFILRKENSRTLG